MNKESSGSHAGAVIGGCVGMLLLLYVFLPVVFAIPILHATDRGILPENVMVAFLPLEALGKAIPAYSALIHKEVDFCRSLGLVPN